MQTSHTIIMPVCWSWNMYDINIYICTWYSIFIVGDSAPLMFSLADLKQVHTFLGPAVFRVFLSKDSVLCLFIAGG